MEEKNQFACRYCKTPLSLGSDLLSKVNTIQAFRGRSGKAYLFVKVVNVTEGVHEESVLMTGLHTICDINCKVCREKLGWKYVEAYEETQKYKVGKFILERAHLKKLYWQQEA